MSPLGNKELAISISFLVIAVSGQLSQNNWQNQQQQYGDNNQNEDCCEDYCYATDENPYLYFGTKTAYDNLKRRSGQQHIVPECTPVQFWSINRHGTRLPSAERIEKLRALNRLHEEVTRNYLQRKSYPDKGNLCQQDYDIFRRWRWNDTITEEKAHSLTSQGIEDMKLLARRYKDKYSQILQGSYDERAFYFQYTNAEKTHDSYQAFIEGLFGSEAYRVHANTFNDDRLTKPEESCKTWTERNEVLEARNEYYRFLEKPEYLKLARDVFRRLGFRYSLNASIISDLYDMCRYEKAWYVQQRSPWCTAFTKTQLTLLEYAEDLKHYYKSGYGNKMSEKVGCAPVKDFYERFEKTINGNSDGNKATFFFTHSTTIQSVLTALGIAKDYTPLTADNFYQQSRRNWRTSILDPFASNLAAILYKCGGNERYKVMFFLNEVPVEFPECSVGLCNWSTVQQKFQSLVDNCNIDDFCNGNSASLHHLNSVIYLLIIPLFFYFKA